MNSGEKWLAHSTPANRTHATTGNDNARVTREWSTGRMYRRRVSGEDAWSRSVIGPAMSSSGGPTSVSSRCWTMCSENSVVS